MKVLGIETSCDETGVAILEDRKVLASITYTQMVHERFGGVVPEIASREHILKLSPLTEEVLSESDVRESELDAVAVTRGPGLLPSLLIGYNFGKGLSLSLNINFVGVNHLEAHIYSPFLNRDEFSPPFLALLVSGGHTQLVKIDGLRRYSVLGMTQDDACGEAFDKVSKLIGLGYPGGPSIEKWAKRGNPDAFDLPVPDPGELNFSYSGLKTAVLYLYQDLSQEERIRRIADLAASFQKVAVGSLIMKLKKAVKLTGIDKVVVAGGVSANKLLKERLNEIDTCCAIPEPEFTTDNGAMIAYMGYKLLKKGMSTELNSSVNPGLRLMDDE